MIHNLIETGDVRIGEVKNMIGPSPGSFLKSVNILSLSILSTFQSFLNIHPAIENFCLKYRTCVPTVEINFVEFTSCLLCNVFIIFTKIFLPRADRCFNIFIRIFVNITAIFTALL